MEIGDKGNGGRKGEEWNGPHITPPPRYRVHAISRTSPRAARLGFRRITFVELGNGFNSMGHGGRRFPAVLGDVKPPPMNEILQLAAREARILNEIDLPFFVTINQIGRRWWGWNLVREGRWSEGAKKIVVESTASAAAGTWKTQAIRRSADLGINGVRAHTAVIKLLHGSPRRDVSGF